MEIAWKDVLRDWEADEIERYRELYEARGFSTWLEWRQSYISDLGLEQRVWTQEVLENAYDVVPTFYIGGYKGWYPYRPADKALATFADVGCPPSEGEMSLFGEPRVNVRTNEGVMRFTREKQPATLLVLQSGDFKVVLDGTHRSASIAVSAYDSLEPMLEPVTIRTCQFDESERALLESFANDRASIVKK